MVDHKLNCWEFKMCGRQPGGFNTKTLGVCTSATTTAMNGINGGINGGRVCWLVSGTYGKSRAELADCTAIKNIASCYDCDFHSQVLTEEGYTFTDSNIIEKLENTNKYALPER